MKFLIDTSSLVAMVRYYIPFEKSDSLKKLIKSKIQSGDIILLDKVADEAGLVSKKIVVKTLDFIGDKNFKQRQIVYCHIPSSLICLIMNLLIIYRNQS